MLGSDVPFSHFDTACLLTPKLSATNSWVILHRVLWDFNVSPSVFLISFFYEYNFTLGFVCVNLASLMFSSSKDTSFKRQLFAKKKFKNLSRGMIERNIYVSEKTKDYSLFKFIDDYHFVNFIFLDESGNEVKRLSEVEFYQRQGLL